MTATNTFKNCKSSLQYLHCSINHVHQIANLMQIKKDFKVPSDLKARNLKFLLSPEVFAILSSIKQPLLTVWQFACHKNNVFSRYT